MRRRPDFIGLSLASMLVLGGCKKDDDSGDGNDGTSSSTDTSNASSSASGPTSGPTTTAGSATTSVTTTTGPTTGVDSTGGTGQLTCPYDAVDGQPGVALELVATGFDRPILAVGHPTDPDRLFVAEQGGNVRILEPGMTEAPAEAFLTVDSVNGTNSQIGDERGLLGFALHPDFPADPRVYVAYNPSGSSSPPTRVEEYTMGNDGKADPASARVVIAADQPAGNHNGGMIAFGPDDYLYFGTGDGGQGNDAFDTGRDGAKILAKILRIGVEPDGNQDSPVACDNDCQQLGPFDYTIPADNPFVDDPGFAPEVWAWGFRNPWRFSFDPQNGDFYVADVGQNQYEEIDLVAGGSDHGWSDMEGFHCFGGASCDVLGPNEVNPGGITMPLVEYGHGSGRCSVTGLGVYRSCEVPAFDGVYFYGDYCSGEVFALAWDGQSVDDLGTVWNSGDSDRIIGGGSNAYGDVFVTTVIVPFQGAPIEDGRVYRIAPAR